MVEEEVAKAVIDTIDFARASLLPNQVCTIINSVIQLLQGSFESVAGGTVCTVLVSVT